MSMNRTSRTASSATGASADDVRVADILESAIARRLSGEDVSDDQILSDHPEIAALLRRRLRILRRVEDARSTADHLEHRVEAAEPIPSDAIPGYRIIEEIHRGAQGVVFRAVQLSTHRDVAVKVLRDGPFAGPFDRMRFEREVRILAQLQHPHIVAIHDSGTAAGRTFLVMDLIAGERFDSYCDRIRADGARSSRDALLRLFAEICYAVHAAHLRGVIHRDLKPGNILVTAGQPRILDFGLAKLASETIGGGESAPTSTGQFVGSLPWSSPEQADGRSGDIDIRSDVYSLGVMLHQLLTGRFPYPVTGPIRHVIENIVSIEPPPPSRATAWAGRDLDAIVAHGLAKSRERRYQSAGALAEDIRRYLDGRPILARRDSTGYVLMKALRRHRFAAAVVTTFVLLVSGSSVALLLLYGQAERQAEAARRERDRSQQAESRAEQETRRALNANDFLRQMLTSIDPESAQRSLRVVDLLDKAGPEIDTVFADSSETRASLHDTIGRAYGSLALPEKAEPHLRAAVEIRRTTLGPDHRETLRSMHTLAESMLSNRPIGDVNQLARETLAARRLALGNDDPDTLQSINFLANVCRLGVSADEADSLQQEALAARTRVLGPDHRDTLISLSRLAWLRKGQRKNDDAERLFRDVLERQRRALGPSDRDTLDTANLFGLVLRDLGRRDEAEAIFRDHLQRRRDTLGEDHPTTAMAYNNLAVVMHDAGRLSEAESLHRAALDIRRSFPPDFPETLFSLNHLAMLLIDLNRLDEADAIAHEAVERGRRLPPAASLGLHMAGALTALGSVRLEQGLPGDAEPLLREAWKIHGSLGNPDRRIVIVESALGAALTELDKYEEAEPLVVESVTFTLADPSTGVVRRERTIRRAATLYEKWKKPDQAAKYRELLAARD